MTKVERMEEVLIKGMTIATMVMAIVTGIVLYWGETKLNIRKNEKLLEVEFNPNFPYATDSSTKEECVRDFLDTLRIPPITVEEFNSINMELKQAAAEMEVQFVALEDDEEYYMQYTDEDLELLAQVMYAEEGIFFTEWEENPEIVERVHKLAGSVVLNRLANEYRGSTTIKEVIFCKGQYAKMTQDKVTKGQEMPEEVYTWAEELLKDGPLGPNNLIFQSQFEQGDAVYEIIGNQYFCTWDNLPAEREEKEED